MTIERVLIVFNADRTIRGVATYGPNGAAVEATADELDALIAGAGAAATIAELRQQVELSKTPAVVTAEPAATGAYAAIRAALTPAERDSLTVRLTATGTANRALQGLIADATTGLPVDRAALLDAMTAATVITAARAAELA